MRNRMIKIYTKFGDRGETGLLYGGRVSKSDPYLEAYGTTDEAVSTLGLARSLSNNTYIKTIIKGLQADLFTVGAELSTSPRDHEKLEKHFTTISQKMTLHLEEQIDELTSHFTLPKSFIIPGNSSVSAALDMARTIVRRAERQAVKLSEMKCLSNLEVLRYLNRLSDLLFILARFNDRETGFEEFHDPSPKRRSPD